jgi:hypothetical protein
MKKGAAKQARRKPKQKPQIVVPPSPFDFEETVRRVLKVKPPTDPKPKKR